LAVHFDCNHSLLERLELPEEQLAMVHPMALANGVVQ